MSEHEPQPDEPEQPPGPEATTSSEQPRVWIGSLADYTNGLLHGEWMDAAVEPDVLAAHIHAMLARSETQTAEEWMIFDHEHFAGYHVSEYEDLDTLTAVARGIAEHGPAFGVFAEIHNGNPNSLAQFGDAYLGAWESREAWAQSIVDDFNIEGMIDRDLGLPEWLKGYIQIDLKGIADHLHIGGDVMIEKNPDGGVWVFDGRM